MDSTGLIAALAPAFAAGFAVQRLLEILDPLAETVAGTEKKKIVLGLSSLVAGLGFAAGVGLRVLVHLGTYTFGRRWDRHDLVDLFVTGLVISAGTEGFNSILKFMSYKKEETKAAANTKALAAASTQTFLNRRLTMNTATNESPEDGLDTIEITGDLKADLAEALKAQLQARFPDQFIEDGWDERTFDAYITDQQLFKVQAAAQNAARAVANGYQITLSDQSLARIRGAVKLDSNPKALLGAMYNEVSGG